MALVLQCVLFPFLAHKEYVKHPLMSRPLGAVRTVRE